MWYDPVTFDSRCETASYNVRIIFYQYYWLHRVHNFHNVMLIQQSIVGSPKIVFYARGKDQCHILQKFLEAKEYVLVLRQLVVFCSKTLAWHADLFHSQQLVLIIRGSVCLRQVFRNSRQYQIVDVKLRYNCLLLL